MSSFCKMSGQKVNLSKSKLFFSHGIPRIGILSEKTNLSTTIGIPMTNDLGVYLAMSLLHKLLSSATYDNMSMAQRLC